MRVSLVLHAALVGAFACPCTAYDVLVAMHDAGTIECYDGATGSHRGTFAVGIDNPNCLAWGPDGTLYVSTGPLNGPGGVERFDPATGELLGYLVPPATSGAGRLVRGTGMAFRDGKLYVASCDDGRIVCFDATTGAWLSDFATVSTVGPTEIEFHGDALCVADFVAQSVRRFDAGTGAALPDLTAIAGYAPWGLAFDSSGRLFWSGSGTGGHTIQRLDSGSTTLWAGPHSTLNAPVALALSPDGLIYCSSYFAHTVTVWPTDQPSAGGPIRVILGPEVRGPNGIAFTERPVPMRPAPIELESSTKSARVRVQAEPDHAALPYLSWDTEGGDRARTNLLRAPVRLRLVGRSGDRPSVELQRRGSQGVVYRLGLVPGGAISWDVALRGGGLAMTFGATGTDLGHVRGLELELPLDPRATATTVLTGNWSRAGRARLPFIISAPDLGQMYVSCAEHRRIEATLEGDRQAQTVTLTFRLPVPEPGTAYTLDFRPHVIAAPAGLKDTMRWRDARRGWLNFLQLSSTWCGQPGIWANNVVSDPVSSTVFWLADHALLVPELAPGVSTADMVRRSVEYWLDGGRTPEGEFYYVVNSTLGMMDSYPSILIASWAYVEATGDTAWLKRRLATLEDVSAMLERRDTDGDGLVESKQSGNRGTHAFGDTAWDTYSSGHKNAYVNALTYRAWRCLARLEGRLGHVEREVHYAALADKLKAAFVPAFLNPETGWLGWWRSEDGFLHDVYSDVPTSLAIMYGLVDADRGRDMLDRYWAALQASGFERFDLGVPLNIRPVHRDDQYAEWGGKAEDGSDTFGKYLNGGCCVSNTSFFLVANYIVGRTDRADRILDAMLKRQREGVFANGGGFQNGVINRYPEGAEFMDWQGNTCGYEGHLVYSWAFLQSVLLREPQFRARWGWWSRDEVPAPRGPRALTKGSRALTGLVAEGPHREDHPPGGGWWAPARPGVRRPPTGRQAHCGNVPSRRPIRVP